MPRFKVPLYGYITAYSDIIVTADNAAQAAERVELLLRDRNIPENMLWDMNLGQEPVIQDIERDEIKESTDEDV